MTFISTSTCVYRAFDSDGALLYVGCTSNHQRFDNHRRSDWFGICATITVEHFLTRDEALAAEREAIATESPRFNRTFGETFHSRRRIGATA